MTQDRESLLEEQLQVRKALAEQSLVAYIRLMWPVLEPGRQFVTGWCVDAICEHLEAVTAGELRRLLINVPPGCMKSLTTNVFWSTWEWGPRNMAWLRWVSSSYSQDLTIRDNRKARMLIDSKLYQRLWGDRFQLSSDQNAKTRFDNDKTGFKVATSVEGMGTGERGDRFVLDDPHNVKQAESVAKREGALQYFSETMPTRITDPEKSAVVVIMQRVHERDVSGLILAANLGYEHLMLPMEYEKERACTTGIGFEDPRREDGELLWPERFSKSYLDTELKPQLRSWGGTYAEAGQLQQRPAPRGGGMFAKDKWNYIDQPEDLGEPIKWLRSWDLAASANAHAAFTVGAKMGITARSKKIVVADIQRGQLSPAGVEALLLKTAVADGNAMAIDIPLDPGQAGLSQKRAISALLSGYVLYWTPDKGSKEDRALPLASQHEAGNVYLVRAPWNSALVAEGAVFPNSEFKDQIDALSKGYSRLLGKKSEPIPAAPRLIRPQGGYQVEGGG